MFSHEYRSVLIFKITTQEWSFTAVRQELKGKHLSGEPRPLSHQVLESTWNVYRRCGCSHIQESWQLGAGKHVQRTWNMRPRIVAAPGCACVGSKQTRVTHGRGLVAEPATSLACETLAEE